TTTLPAAAAEDPTTTLPAAGDDPTTALPGATVAPPAGDSRDDGDDGDDGDDPTTMLPAAIPAQRTDEPADGEVTRVITPQKRSA
ncbi:hypothetical protein, partial [Spirilliplanes yamanashiensis]